MTGETYYYICNRCGSIADIAAAPHGEGVTWACADCGCERLTEFTDQDVAMAQSNAIRDANFNAEMETLNRRLRALDAQ